MGTETDVTAAYDLLSQSSPANGWTLAQMVNQINRGGYAWGHTGLTFGFPTKLPSDYNSSYTEAAGFSAFTAAEAAAAREVLQLYSDVCGLTFTEVSGTGAEIRMQNSTTLDSYAAAWAYFPGSGVGGDLWNNSSISSQLDMTRGGYAYTTFLHELGHALGLQHPGDYDASKGAATYAKDAVFAEDSRMYTVMSYFEAGNTGANHGSYYAETPLLLDIAALQAKYGANTTTRSGDTTYGFHSTAGRVAFDFSTNKHPIVCLYDTGGTDTLDLSGFTSASWINLTPGGFSDAGGLTKNISIAYGTWIENAIGGAGNDVFFGNDRDNVLVGNGGDDTFTPGGGHDVIYGGSGSDTVLLAGSAQDYSVTIKGSDYYAVRGANSELLDGVEYVKFLGNGVSYEIADFFAATFDALGYLCSYADLRLAFGANTAAAIWHWNAYGQAEGRSSHLFDALAYVASYGDLVAAFSTNGTAAEIHYLLYGATEGRTISFDAAAYAASYADLTKVYGLTQDWSGAESHYILWGRAEGRTSNGFDAVTYRLANADVTAAPVTFDAHTLAVDWLTNQSARSLTGLYGTDQSSHSLTIGVTLHDSLTTADRDWFNTSVSAGQTYSIQAIGSSSGGGTLAHSYLRLYDSTGQLLVSNGGSGVNSATITYMATSTGTLYISVGSNNDAEAGTYSLVVQAAAGATASGPATSVEADAASDFEVLGLIGMASATADIGI